MSACSLQSFLTSCITHVEVDVHMLNPIPIRHFTRGDRPRPPPLVAGLLSECLDFFAISQEPNQARIGLYTVNGAVEVGCSGGGREDLGVEHVEHARGEGQTEDNEAEVEGLLAGASALFKDRKGGPWDRAGVVEGRDGAAFNFWFGFGGRSLVVGCVMAGLKGT